VLGKDEGRILQLALRARQRSVTQMPRHDSGANDDGTDDENLAKNEELNGPRCLESLQRR
jgi:hypothetical protein